MAERTGMQKFGNALQGFGAGFRGKGGEFIERQRLEKERREQKLLDQQKEKTRMAKTRQEAMALDFRNIGLALDGGFHDQARRMLNDRMRVGSMLPDFDPKSSSYLMNLFDQAQDNPGAWDEAREFLNFSDQMAVQGGFIEPKPKPEYVNPNMLTDRNELLISDPVTREVRPQQTGLAPPPPEVREIQSADAIGKGGAQMLVYKDGGTGYIGRDGVEVTDPQERAAAIARELNDEIVRAGDQARTVAQQQADVSRLTAMFEQVGQIRENNAVLDEALVALDGGAKSGYFDNMIPLVGAATATLRNLGLKLGLGRLSTVTLGAVSESEMNIVMDESLPIGTMDEPDLRKWIEDRKRAQNKIANEIDKFIVFSGQGGTVDEWIIEQKEVYRDRQRSRFPNATDEEFDAAMKYEEENGIRF